MLNILLANAFSPAANKIISTNFEFGKKPGFFSSAFLSSDRGGNLKNEKMILSVSYRYLYINVNHRIDINLHFCLIKNRKRISAGHFENVNLKGYGYWKKICKFELRHLIVNFKENYKFCKVKYLQYPGDP